MTLSTPQELAKLAALADEKNASSRKVKQLEDRIAKLTAVNGIDVGEEFDADLKSITDTESENICSAFAEGSFQYLFWKQQMEARSATGPQQRRWHPLLIKWCLNLEMISSAAYNNLRTSGMFILPSERTLRDYSNVVKSGEGYQMGVLRQLHDEARMGLDEIPAHRQFVGIVVVELYIKSDLVYDRYSSRVIGFVNLSTVDQQIAALEQSTFPTVATRVRTVMVTGILFRLNFPLANFSTAGITSISLFDILWTAVQHLKRCDFTVVFQTANGSSPNRRYFCMHRDPAAAFKIVYKAINPYSAMSGRAIYFFADPPHLMKTTQNCLANSGSHTFSHNMWNGMDITWKHLLQLQDALRHCSRQSGGLTIGHKLKTDFHLTSYSKMRVNLTVQILSHTTSEALKYYGIQGSAATQTLLRFMDRFFDMLNVRSKVKQYRRGRTTLRCMNRQMTVS